MHRPGPASRLLTMVLALAPAACGDDPPTEAPPALTRAVVEPGQPLFLRNTQRDALTWPIWGSAFRADDAVAARVTLDIREPRLSGLVLAGPGEVSERHTIDFLHGDDGWFLREARGGVALQRVDVPAPPGGTFDLVVQPYGQALSVITHAGRRYTLAAREALARPGETLGFDVYIGLNGYLVIEELSMSDPMPVAPELGQPLRELAPAGVTIGSATDVWPPLHDLGFESLLGAEFDLAAPSELYWTTTRGEDPDFFTVPADLMVNYAGVHGQRARGYFLVWDVELPGWLSQLAESGGGEAVGQALEQHIETLVGRYRGRVGEWVVVNEPIWGPEETGGDAQLAETFWSDLLGPEYIDVALTTARDADPDAVLLINETGAEVIGPKSDFLFQMASDLLDRGVPLDGVGLQFHIDAAAPPDMAEVAANMERFGALGLGVYITELDVNLISLDGEEAEKLDRQAEIFARLLDTCLSVAACKSYTMWGFSDRYAWYDREEGAEAPLPFDDEFRAKPAFFAIQSVLQGFARTGGM